MNQQILEYLQSKDLETSLLGVELIVKLKKGRLQYLVYADFHETVSYDTFWELHKQLIDNKCLEYDSKEGRCIKIKRQNNEDTKMVKKNPLYPQV